MKRPPHLDALHGQTLLLREISLPGEQHTQLLDLLYAQTERVIHAEFLQLKESSLPISRKLRLRLRLLLELLETLCQHYLNSLATLFDPLRKSPPRSPAITLRRALHAIGWQIEICHFVATPPTKGIWQQLHGTFRTARRLGVAEQAGEHNAPSIERIYSSILLAAIAQPISFSAAELAFIRTYIEQCAPTTRVASTPPSDADSTFWIDPDKDYPAHALIRRAPPPELDALYFSCEAIARHVLKKRSELIQGATAEQIGLPPFAATHAGKSVLLRLGRLWGHPLKRKFSRRRQSYRTRICPGLKNLWSLLRDPAAPAEVSEWMVTNESPDGYAVMHVSGPASGLRVGDIAALLSRDTPQSSGWHICIVRWALSENPEHIELGLELLATQASAVEISNPQASNGTKLPALLIPAAPPIRPRRAVALASGALTEGTRQIIVLGDDSHPEIRSLQAVHLDEQTSSIDVFNVLSGN